MKKTILTGLLLLTAFSAIVWAQTRAKVTRVKFPAGKTSVELSGTQRGTTENVYLVRARAGQTMSVRLTLREDERAALHVRDSKDKMLQSNDGTYNTHDYWENTLKKSGDYRVVVAPPDAVEETDVARYKLEISVE